MQDFPKLQTIFVVKKDFLEGTIYNFYDNIGILPQLKPDASRVTLRHLHVHFGERCLVAGLRVQSERSAERRESEAFGGVVALDGLTLYQYGCVAALHVRAAGRHRSGHIAAREDYRRQ